MDSALTVGEVGRRVAAWRRRNFGEQSLYRHLAQLTEEAGEVAEAAGVVEGDLSAEEREALGKELGDVIASACGLAAVMGLDLESPLAALVERRPFRPFGGSSRLQRALRISKAVGDVARAIGKTEEGIRPQTRGALAPTLALVVLEATDLALAERFDLDAILRARLERMEALDFRADPEGGEAR